MTRSIAQCFYDSEVSCKTYYKATAKPSGKLYNGAAIADMDAAVAQQSVKHASDRAEILPP